MSTFVHLHLHTEYSLLDGFARTDRLFERVKQLGMTAVAMTDHGVMFGAVDFYKGARAHGIKPIIGCEVYLAARGMADRDGARDKHSSHLVLLAENATGYQQLIKLVSKGYTDGFYYHPRIDKALLAAHSEGIIALSACLGGDVQRALSHGNYSEAKRLVEGYLQIFDRDHFYLELQDHGLTEQKKVNQLLLRLANELNVSLVATNDVHYIDRADAAAHDVLLAIQTGKTLSDRDRLRFPSDQFYLKSPEEMAELFHYIPQALANTVAIADRCQFDFDFETRHLPVYHTPDGQSAKAFLGKLCEQRFAALYGDSLAARQRLALELEIINDMGYADYFLIVWDFVSFARQNDIAVGPCRGSGGGSLVAYLLAITDIDPLRYNLIFERFLNPERITMPDFDIDFQDDRRGEVIDYVIAKYGADHVAQIITFGTMGARGAIRDVGRVLGMAYRDVDAVAKAIPFALGITIDQALKSSRQLADQYRAGGEVKQLIDTAKAIEGMPRHASTHAAGVVIGQKPIDAYVPLYVHDGGITTQYTMTRLEDIGLLKFDFLGLRTLTIIQHTLAQIANSTGRTLDISTIPMDDPQAFALIASGRTLGIFQLESAGIIRFMKSLKPASIEDIIAGISLYRPGPMDSIPTYIKNKNNPRAIRYVTPELESILSVTYGCLVYQEQVMQTVRKLAGYSYGRSDLVRRAMSKKKMDVMQKERELFVYGLDDKAGNVVIRGCVRNGIAADIAETIFDDMIDFAKYAFNKSHAAGYAVIAYQTAYLKAHYPVAFMAASMTANMTSQKKIAQYIKACRDMQIAVLPPDVNQSTAHFSVAGTAIRFALLAIKHVGKGIINNIVAEREVRPYSDFEDFLERLDPAELNKKAIESLIKAGAVDGLGKSRAVLITNFEQLIDRSVGERRHNARGQISMTEDLLDVSVAKYRYKERAPFTTAIRLNFEKEMLGVYVSGHPLDPYRHAIARVASIHTGELTDDDSQPICRRDGQHHRMAGMITRVVEKGTKKGETMAFLTLEDFVSTVEVVVFASVLQQFRAHIKVDHVVVVNGVLSLKEDSEPALIADGIQPLKAIQAPAEQLYVRVDVLDGAVHAKLQRICAVHQGASTLKIYQVYDGRRLEFKQGVTVSDALIAELRRAFGDDNVKSVPNKHSSRKI